MLLVQLIHLLEPLTKPRHDGATWVANDFLYNTETEIGVGTTNPQAIFDINHSTSASAVQFDAPFRIKGGGQLTMGTHTDYGWVQTWAEDDLNLNPVGNNVGIGLTDPSQKLDVNGQIRMRGTSGTAGYIPVSDVDGVMTWTDPTTISTAKDHDWYEDGTTNEPQAINSDIYTEGNVEIKDGNLVLNIDRTLKHV